MQPRYRIRDGLGFCRFEGRTIILDIVADRYWQLGDAAGLVLDAVQSGRMDSMDVQALARLEMLGFVVPADGGSASLAENHAASAAHALPRPSGSALEQAGARASTGWMIACEVAAFAIIARIALRMFALKTILARLGARRKRGSPLRRSTDLEALARRFGQARRLLPLRPLCLPDSIAFLWFAARRGHAPRLVFGVEAFPFTAHCWAQEGTIVLTDALDHASRFKPIMVL